MSGGLVKCFIYYSLKVQKRVRFIRKFIPDLPEFRFKRKSVKLIRVDRHRRRPRHRRLLEACSSVLCPIRAGVIIAYCLYRPGWDMGPTRPAAIRLRHTILRGLNVVLEDRSYVEPRHAWKRHNFSACEIATSKLEMCDEILNLEILINLINFKLSAN